MTAWIADGEAGSSVRAKLNASMIPILSVAISSPVEYVDIALPTGFSSFALVGSSILLDTQDYLAAVLSFDGGVTFLSDFDFADSYYHEYHRLSGASNFNPQGGSDSIFKISGLADTTSRILLSLQIDPGGSDHYTLVSADAVCGVTAGEVWRAGAIVNGDANAAPAPARANLIKLLPYGIGDVPPTSGEMLTAGTFTLFGIPAP